MVDYVQPLTKLFFQDDIRLDSDLYLGSLYLRTCFTLLAGVPGQSSNTNTTFSRDREDEEDETNGEENISARSKLRFKFKI